MLYKVPVSNVMHLSFHLPNLWTQWENSCESFCSSLALFGYLSLHQLCLCVSSGGAAGPRLNNNQLYKFSYSTEVLMDRTRGSKDGSAGYRISSDVDVNLVWRDPSSKDDQLIQLAVSRYNHVTGGGHDVTAYEVLIEQFRWIMRIIHLRKWL